MLKRSSVTLCFVFIFVISLIVMPFVAQNAYASTIPTKSNQFEKLPEPPKERPRVLVNKSMLPALRERMKTDDFKTAMDNYSLLAEKNIDGNLPTLDPASRTNIDPRIYNVMKACAFLYLVNEDKAMGKKAVSIAVNMAKTVEWKKDGTSSDVFYISQQTGMLILLESIVYDWCYPLLSESDKATIAKSLDTLVRTTLEYPYPIDPAKKSVMVGHLNNYVTHNYKLAMGIALYDTNPDYFNDVVNFELNQVIPALNVSLDSEMYYDGLSYGEVRMTIFMAMTQMLKVIGVDVVSPKIGYAPDRLLYTRRPDGYNMTEGDDFNAEYSNPWTRTVAGSFMHMLAGSVYGNKYAQFEFKKQGSKFVGPSVTDLYFLCWYNPQAESKSIYEAPLSRYFPSPYGSIVARTGWEEGADSKAVVAVMNIGERTTTNHQHCDAGSFQLYYKGYLAIDSGMYQGKNGEYGSSHDFKYHKLSIAHNVVQINDPNSSDNFVGGGQLFPQAVPLTIETWNTDPSYQRGKVLSSSIGDDKMYPDYSFIKGELAPSYGLTRVKSYRRSMVFLNFKDDTYPGALIVYDNINTPNASAEKKFLLHSINEPEVKSNMYTNVMAERGYNGKLVTNTLLPKADNLSVVKVGGTDREFVDGDGENQPQISNNPSSMYANEAGKWRLEISPKKPTNVTQFLNVMQVMDATNGPEPQKAYYTESNDFVGTMIYDRVVFFAKNFVNIEKETTISFKGDLAKEYKILVTDLAEGYWTAVKVGETAKVQYEVVENGNCLYFVGKPGTYIFTRSDKKTLDLAEKVPSKSVKKLIKVKLDGKNIEGFDVPPQIINDRTMVPMRKIFEALGMTVTWDSAKNTAKAIKKNLTIELTQDSNIAKVNGKEVTIDAPATVVNDRTLVPVRFIAESSGCWVTWNAVDENVEILTVQPVELPKFVKISLPKITPVANKDLQLLTPATTTATQNADTVIRLFDDNLEQSSSWAGRDNGVYAEFDFGKEVRLDRVDLAIVAGTTRQVRMTFYTSSDGIEWTPIYGGDASGTTNELESYNLTPVKLRYFRLVGFGAPDTGSVWFSATELKFWGKK